MNELHDAHVRQAYGWNFYWYDVWFNVALDTGICTRLNNNDAPT